MLKGWFLVLTAGLGALSAAASGQASKPRGERLWLQCRSCHTLEAGEPHKVGPNLHGIVGAPAATRRGYVYSPALRAAGLRWTDSNLEAFLYAPSRTVRGTKMAYAGMSKPEDRAALIAFLKDRSR
jgi:cytochrome c